MLSVFLSAFLSSFLLFQVQPLIGKYILPWFGGTPAVWSTAMLFFQALLVGGYAYAHWLVGRLSPRRQAIVHLALLGVSLGLLLALGLAWDSPLTPGVRWKPQGAGNPQWQVLRILAVAVGLPYLVLSANSPLMQVWLSYHQPVRSPQRLYALSNAGSLVGLLTFPFLVEPMLALKAQANLWVWGYVVFAVCLAYTALRALRLSAASLDCVTTGAVPKAWSAAEGGVRPSVRVRLLWVALSACGSVMLLATTNQISQDVSVTPFLWVLPLALYLLSFVLCFSDRRWYWRAGYAVALFVATVFFCSVFCYGRGTLLSQIGVYGVVLFVCCMICHGELARLQPHPGYLTSFYLLISVGGTLGGVVVNLIAPYVFPGFWELPIGLLACWILLLLVFFGDERKDRGRWFNLLADWLARGLEGGGVILGVVLFFYASNSLKDVLWSSRNYYGVLRVKEMDIDGPYERAHVLLHGDTVHGFQILDILDEERRPLPTAYYTEESGMGLAILNHPRRDAGLRIGAVGLGVGTLAAYGRPGDTIRFYEINPDVIRLAEGEGGYFTYLRDCPAQVEVVPGDARVSMEQELAAGDLQQFDLLVVDAFNSGSVPVHLLTKEAFDIYLRHLQPDGIVALHISNPYLDLGPVVQGLADLFRLGTAFIVDDGGDGGRGYSSAWMLVTRDGEFLERPEIAGRSSPQQMYAGLRLWTDDYSSVLPILLNRRPLAEGLLGDVGPQ